MPLGPALTVLIAVVLCVGVLVLLAWVWARALEVREPTPRRRRVGRGQLIALPLLLLLLGVRPSSSGSGPPDSGPVVALRLGVAGALILALVLYDQDLRRRADDPRTRHRVTGWGIAAIAAVVSAVALVTAEVWASSGEPAIALAVPGSLVALGALGVLDLAVARAILRRRLERAARAGERTDR
jgi:hypothetical protein